MGESATGYKQNAGLDSDWTAERESGWNPGRANHPEQRATLAAGHSNFSNGWLQARQKCIDRHSDGPFGCSRSVSSEPQ
jgi:hypothetical protein